ncbi:type VI secretion system ImpA family N-terminal domain-containing protein, partial [Azonexus sp.]|uniref:type VI secretion system protein TssA n=1 Tax=Azonexus sp. TaxID=1872668 RepID=UPI0028356A24
MKSAKIIPPLGLPMHCLALLDPVAVEAPCGIDLEYHPDLLVLLNRLAGQEAAQYGDFVAPQEPTNWKKMETALLAVLEEGRDLRVLVPLARCRIHQAGVAGAHQGLWLIAEMLYRYPDEIHPQLAVDGERDPTLRANTLAQLADNDTFFEDLRGIVLDGNNATFLSLRDIERAFTLPRPPKARTPESVVAQIADLKERDEETLRHLGACLAEIRRIVAWCETHLGDCQPDLTTLQTLFAIFEPNEETALATAPEAPVMDRAAEPMAVETADEPDKSANLTAPYHANDTPEAETKRVMPRTKAKHEKGCDGATVNGREQALAHIQAARSWFEDAEPSSPVADLLRQAERLTGRRYAEIADAIPLELLRRWEEGDGR